MKRFVCILSLNKRGDKDDKLRLKKFLQTSFGKQSNCEASQSIDLLTNSEIEIMFPNVGNNATSKWLNYTAAMEQFDSLWASSWCDVDGVDRNCPTSFNHSAYLNGVADHLPDRGSCLVDILVLMHHSTVKIEEHLELYGALLRLHSWNDAKIHLFVSENQNSNDIENWKNLLLASVNESKCNPTVWQGAISLGKESSEEPFLPGFSLEVTSFNFFDVFKTHFPSSKLNDDQVVVFDWNMLLVGEYSIQTIPDHLVSEFTLDLHLSCIAEVTQESQEFLQYVGDHSNMSFLLRLGYKYEDKNDKEHHNTAENWKKSLQRSSYPKFSQDKRDEKFLYFLLTKENCVQEHQFKVQLLNNLEKITEGALQKFSSSTTCENIPENSDHSWLQTLPYIPEDCFRVLLKTLSGVQLKENVDLEESSNISATCSFVKMVWKHYNSLAFKNSKFVDTIDVLGNIVEASSSSLEIESTEDPTDWPERRALLHQTLCRETQRQHNKLDTLGGMEPPSSDSLTIALEAKEFLKYFQQSGEPKNEVAKKSTPLVPDKQGHKKFCPKSAPSSDKSLKWPEISLNFCHDTYFNCNEEAEKNEHTCIKLKNNYLNDETVSTCSSVRDQAIEFLSVKKIKLKSQDPSSSMCKSKQRTSLDRYSKSDTAIRRSPRKKYRPSTEKPKYSQQYDLTEKHRLKLRCCVAESLEEHGIGVNHASFKDCGRKLFAVCKPFIKDVIGARSTSCEMKKICDSHVKQVIDFEFGKQKKISSGRRK